MRLFLVAKRTLGVGSIQAVAVEANGLHYSCVRRGYEMTDACRLRSVSG